MNDKEVLDIIFEKRDIDNETLDKLLYSLCDAGDNEDMNTLMNYTHISRSDYDRKICDVFRYICKYSYLIDIFDCSNITNDDIKNMVDVLPTFELIDFIEGCESHYFILVDYEAPDKIFKCDYLLELLEDTPLKQIINNELSHDDIVRIVDYINDLDLFDITLYDEYNEC